MLFGGEGGAGRIDARKVEEEARVELMREEEKAVYVQEKRAVVEEEERVVERKKERRRKKEEEEDEKKRIVRMQLLREKQKREVKKQLKKSRRQKNNKKSKKSKKKKKKKKKNKKKKEEEQDEEQDAPTSSSSAQSPLLGIPTDYCKTTITISQLESGITYQYVHQHCCSPPFLFSLCVCLNLNDNTAIDTNTVFPPISHGIFFFNSTLLLCFCFVCVFLNLNDNTAIDTNTVFFQFNRYRIRAFNNVGWSGWSGTSLQTITTEPTRPEVPPCVPLSGKNLVHCTQADCYCFCSSEYMCTNVGEEYT